jgi:Flp pilus assembly protein protease CpaA
MNQSIANWFVLAIVVVLVLLSLQAEPVTATLGYVLAALLGVALIAYVSKGK